MIISQDDLRDFIYDHSFAIDVDICMSNDAGNYVQVQFESLYMSIYHTTRPDYMFDTNEIEFASVVDTSNGRSYSLRSDVFESSDVYDLLDILYSILLLGVQTL